MYQLHQTHGQLRFSKSCLSTSGVLLEFLRVKKLLALLLALGACWICNSFSRMNLEMEARVGIEPTNAAFAEPCLTTWLPRRAHEVQR